MLRVAVTSYVYLAWSAVQTSQDCHAPGRRSCSCMRARVQMLVRSCGKMELLSKALPCLWVQVEMLVRSCGKMVLLSKLLPRLREEGRRCGKGAGGQRRGGVKAGRGGWGGDLWVKPRARGGKMR